MTNTKRKQNMKNEPHDLSTQKGRNEYMEAMSAPPKKVSALSNRAKFDIWWVNDGQEIATAKFEKQAEENIKPIIDKMPKIQYNNTAEDNNLETEQNNIFWDEIERLAFKDNLHLK